MNDIIMSGKKESEKLQHLEQSQRERGSQGSLESRLGRSTHSREVLEKFRRQLAKKDELLVRTL